MVNIWLNQTWMLGYVRISAVIISPKISKLVPKMWRAETVQGVVLAGDLAVSAGRVTDSAAASFESGISRTRVHLRPCVSNRCYFRS